MKIAISGATGRMGRSLIKTILNNSNLTLSGALGKNDSKEINTDVGDYYGKKTGIFISSDINKIFSESECIIDFTQPKHTMLCIDTALKMNKKLIIGTTGFNNDQKKIIHQASKKIAIVFTYNFSIMINIIFKILKFITPFFLKKYDIEIIEKHHRKKKDAPSGTALIFGKIISNILGYKLKDCAIYDRRNTKNKKYNSIGFSSIRIGNISGEHTILFSDKNELIEITHKSYNRKSYINGILKSIHFIKKHKNGLFDMQEVLNINK